MLFWALWFFIGDCWWIYPGVYWGTKSWFVTYWEIKRDTTGTLQLNILFYCYSKSIDLLEILWDTQIKYREKMGREINIFWKLACFKVLCTPSHLILTANILVECSYLHFIEEETETHVLFCPWPQRSYKQDLNLAFVVSKVHVVLTNLWKLNFHKAYYSDGEYVRHKKEIIYVMK